MKDKSLDNKHPERHEADWTNVLRHKLEDYQMAVPDDLWEDISEKLPKKEGRIVSLWQRWKAVAAVLAFLLLSGATGYYWYLSSGKDSPVIIATKNIVRHDLKEKSVEESASSEPLQKVHVPLSKKVKIEKREKIQTDSINIIEEPTPQEEKEEQAVTEQVIPPSSRKQGKMTASTDILPLMDEKESLSTKSGKKQRGLSVHLYASNLLASAENMQNVRMSENLARNYDFTYPQQGNARRAPTIYLLNYYERKKHYQPISFGLTVGYNWRERWQLSTGVVYSRLRSVFTNAMASDIIQKHQTLHYIGMPASVNFLLWRNRWANLYLAVNGEMLFNIKADWKTGGVHQYLKKDRPQFSTGASAGAQFNMLPQLGIYMETGGRYYFNNGSDIENTFKEKPLQLSIQTGLRWNF